MDVEVAGLAIALIVVLGLDALACVKPIAYIKDDLVRLGCTPTQIKIIPVAKFAALAGLIIGLWMPLIGVLACCGMILYLGVAFGFHARAGDPVAKYVPAAGFMAFFAITMIVSYLPAV